MKNKEKRAEVIKVLTQYGLHTDKEIGDFMGVSRELVNAIKNNKRWNNTQNFGSNNISYQSNGITPQQRENGLIQELFNNNPKIKSITFNR